MEFMMGPTESSAEPLPNWDVYDVDAFGRPDQLIGGVLGMAATREEALGLFVRLNPAYLGQYVYIVSSTLLPPWSTNEDG